MVRPEQGRYVRMSTFWAIAFLWAYGCYRLSETLSDLRFGWASFLRQPIVGELPLLETPLTTASLLSILVFFAGIAALQMFLNTPKIADTLIETESELRKVTWPTFKDTINASLIVLACVIVLFGLLGVYDALIGKSFDVIFGLKQ